MKKIKRETNKASVMERRIEQREQRHVFYERTSL